MTQGHMGSLAEDTIAAIATAPGEGAIAIVRMSGPRSLEISDAVFMCKGPSPSKRRGGTFVHGYVVQRNKEHSETGGKVLDEAVVLIFRAPHSYTREDVVEFQVHGGRQSAERVLRLLVQEGARIAEPGEFTRRAFLNGRIDLVQAEAVMDMIRAKSDRAASLAAEQMEGRLSNYIGMIYDDLMLAQSDLEATLDFLEDELDHSVLQGVVGRILSAEERMQKLLQSWDEGRVLREGCLVVIAGRPNAGKSTLFNYLLEMDRSIVTRHPGTTRDLIEESMTLNGYPIRLVDTAGIRETSCEIEAEGISRAQKVLMKSDIVLYVVDSSDGIKSTDYEVISTVKAKIIIVLNKVDVSEPIIPEWLTKYEALKCSLKTGVGIAGIRESLVKALSSLVGNESNFSISERHRSTIVSAMERTIEARKMIQEGEKEIALSASCLRDALEMIGSLTGRVYYDSLLDSIFSRFCVGK